MAQATRITSIKRTPPQAVQPVQKGTGEPLIGGVDFWMLAGLAFILDTFQVIALVGHGLATGLMAAAAIPVIGLFLGILTVPAGAMLNFTIVFIGFLLGLALTGAIFLFCLFKKIPVTLPRAGAEGFKLLLEQVPILNILPFNSINIMMLRYFENKRRSGEGGLLGKAAGFVASKNPVGIAGKAITLVK